MAAGEIVKLLESQSAESGRFVKPSTESIARDGKWGNATFPVKTLVQQTMLIDKCARGLSTKDRDQWLIACEVCEGQAHGSFIQCKTSMKTRYVQSKKV